MKTDLATSVVMAIVGAVAAFFLTNLLLPGIEDVSFMALSADPAYTLAEPDDEVFNYRAVNPTVEVYVGQCKEYDENGECVDKGEAVTVVPEEETTSGNVENSSTNNNTNSGQSSGNSLYNSNNSSNPSSNTSSNTSTGTTQRTSGGA